MALSLCVTRTTRQGTATGRSSGMLLAMRRCTTLDHDYRAECQRHGKPRILKAFAQNEQGNPILIDGRLQIIIV